MIDFGKITFSREYDNGECVTHSLSGESSLNEVVEAFEYFLKGCGYGITEGDHLDFVPEHSFDDNVRFDEYGNYGENNPPVAEPTAEKGYPSFEAVNSKKKLWDATPEEWNQAYKNVTMTYNGEPIYKGPRAK